jgi:antitoxin CcdA
MRSLDSTLAGSSSDPTRQLYDRSAVRKATNLSVNTDLLRIARAAGINLSQTLETALESRLADQRRATWLSENEDAINAYNDHVAADGVFSDDRRTF